MNAPPSPSPLIARAPTRAHLQAAVVRCASTSTPSPFLHTRSPWCYPSTLGSQGFPSTQYTFSTFPGMGTTFEQSSLATRHGGQKEARDIPHSR